MVETRPLRVHLIHQGFADYVGGLVDGLTNPERVLGEEEVAATSRPIELRVTTLQSGNSAGVTLDRATLDQGGVGHQTLNLPRFRDPLSLPRAARVIRQVLAEPTDVVHWQAAGNPWVDAAFATQMGRHRTVVTVHDMQAHPGDQNTLPGTFRALRAVARRAELVIVHAPHVFDQGVSAGIEADRLRVLPHGELASRYLPPGQLPAPLEARQRPEPLVLFFGRAQGYKGLDVLAEAMPAVVERVPGARLLVAGAGPSLDEIFPPERSLPNWLEVVRGRVDSSGVVAAFTRASLVALPYREASQSGVAALAAGFGRPVVASAVPGLRDIVEDGVSGVLCEPGSVGALADHLVSVLNDPARLDSLSRGAFRAASASLSWKKIGSTTIDLYHEAAGAAIGGRVGQERESDPKTGSRE